MLVVLFILTLFCVTGQCHIFVPYHQNDNSQKLIHCITGILDKYYSKKIKVTYVNMRLNDDELLKAIHSTFNVTLVSRLSTQQMFCSNLGYLISSEDVDEFIEYFRYLMMEPAWNPYARFLIVIGSLQDVELKLVFDELLKRHVNNVVVVNGTEDAHLYTYNPFDKYACGRYYESVIYYGICSQTTTNLYPNKLVTGLKKCNFRASLSHRPPFTIDPSKTEDKKTFLGTEEYILTMLSKIEKFTVSLNYSNDSETYSTVAPNMTVIGQMEMLQKNECDILFGGMMVATARAEAFTYLCGHHDYSDELRFAVKRSSLVPTWKYTYLEFELNVWCLLLVSFMLFSVVIVILHRSKDAGEIVLQLLDNLLLHGRHIRTRWSVKCVLIMWLWFAYLINTFYQSSLFSFTTHPSMDYQISDEEGLMKYNFKPCFGRGLRQFLYSETVKLNQSECCEYKGCQTSNEAMDTISTTHKVYTLIPNYVYLYNEHRYIDKWGEPLVYYFEKPYAKFLFGYFFYKGFPIPQSLQLNALRMRESGLADKNLQDHYYARKLKQKVSNKEFETRFLFPWSICIPGLITATVVFIMELLLQHAKKIRSISITFK